MDGENGWDILLNGWLWRLNRRYSSIRVRGLILGTAVADEFESRFFGIGLVIVI